MSVAQMAYVLDRFKQQSLSDSEKLLLICLANAADTAEGLCEKYALHPESTQCVLADLVVKGLVRYVENAPLLYYVFVPEGVR